MPSFTCITCRVAFADSEIQRGHYKTDWHRYNLKRKVAELPPVTAEVFQEKVKAQKAEVEAQQQNKDITLHCDLCNKSFSSDNAHSNHLQSKKHKILAEKADRAGLIKDVETVEGNKRSRQTSGSKEIEDAKSSNVEEVDMKEIGDAKSSNVEEVDMKEIGDAKSSSVEEVDMKEGDDDEEEIEEEAIEITDCLFCPHQSISLEDNMKHMSRSHTFFIPDLEYVVDLHGLMGYLGGKVGEGRMCLYCNEKSKMFYSIEAVQSHMVDKGHTKINYDGEGVLEYADFYDFSTSYPDYQPDQGREGEQEVEDKKSALVVDETTSELCLPSGARLGHRDLRHIYKQHLPQERQLQRRVVKNLMADYRALGWHGTVGEVARQRVRDIRLAHKKQARHDIKLSIKANKLQTHFRAQVMF